MRDLFLIPKASNNYFFFSHRHRSNPHRQRSFPHRQRSFPHLQRHFRERQSHVITLDVNVKWEPSSSTSQ